MSLILRHLKRNEDTFLFNDSYEKSEQAQEQTCIHLHKHTESSSHTHSLPAASWNWGEKRKRTRERERERERERAVGHIGWFSLGLHPSKWEYLPLHEYESVCLPRLFDFAPVQQGDWVMFRITGAFFQNLRRSCLTLLSRSLTHSLSLLSLLFLYSSFVLVFPLLTCHTLNSLMKANKLNHSHFISASLASAKIHTQWVDTIKRCIQSPW